MTAPVFTPIDMISKLVSFDTTSRDSNLELIHFVGDYLSAHGVPFDLIYNQDKSKANLCATLGPKSDGGIVLSGHTDVVPVDGQDWDTDPFQLVERDGRLYGRGTTDMKSFSAIALALVPEFLARGVSTPVYFAFSYDEEVGCLGAPDLVQHIVDNVARPKLVIVGEPTNMKVVNAHKGIRAYRTTVTGREAHSSATHLGANAVMAAAQLIQYLSTLAEDMRQIGDSSGRFDPPYTTISVGTIEGGTAINIIPKTCSFIWECRPLPAQEPTDILDRFERFAQDHVLEALKRTAEDSHIVTQPIGIVPPLLPEDNSPADSLVLALAQQNETHAVSYGTEAGIFQGVEIPTVVCGPGNIEQAHRPNEFIEITQVDACIVFIRRLMDVVCRDKV